MKQNNKTWFEIGEVFGTDGENVRAWAKKQEWIDEHEIHYNHWVGAVPVTELQNLLVPKQEELESKIKVLIEAYKQEDGQYSNPENYWIDDFISNLEHLLEEEKRYVVVDNKGSYILAKIKGEIMTMGEILEFYGHESVDIDYNLTEQEIEDYDPRYTSFAKSVEELEE